MSLYFHFIVMPVLSVQMAGFSLSTLNPILLEKVIQKLDLKSYYRLQQTCPEMMDFILTTPKLFLSIWSNRRYGLEYNRTTCSWECNTYRQWKSIPTTGIYGLRVGRLDTADSENILLNRPDRFRTLCAFLKDHRLTCTDLVLDPGYSGMTAEQCVILFNLLKPESVWMTCEGNNMYEVLLRSKTKIMESVLLNIDLEVALNVVKNFLPVYREIKINVNDSDEDPFLMLHAVLKVLFSQPWPHLREFHFSLRYHGDQDNLFTKDELEQQFLGFNINNIEQLMKMSRWGPQYEISAFLEIPQHFPQGSICKLFTQTIRCVNISVTIASRGKSNRQTIVGHGFT